ncbi:LADA_0F08966g1_1 [Lachancea dasiensis]|uniref:LADA_0F08966g1_1 n=1 Tax=Lachancea dasiensis TaxID=1072105 RepID=A0A1G4JKX7_9SACH|nr:LADA_0F08966g1_1 [Lachancea dasiensis]
MSIMNLIIHLNNLHCGNCENYVFELLSQHFEWKFQRGETGHDPELGDTIKPLSRGRNSKNSRLHGRILANDLDFDLKSGLISIGISDANVTTDDKSNRSEPPYADNSLAQSFIKKDLENAGFLVRDIYIETPHPPGVHVVEDQKTPYKPRSLFKSLNMQLNRRKWEKRHIQHCGKCQYSYKQRRDGTAMTEQARSEAQFRAVFAIGGMTCSNCAGIVERSIKEVVRNSVPDNESTVLVSAVNHTATVFIPNKQTVQQIIETVKETGYTAQLLEVLPLTCELRYKLTAAIEGMTCAACASAITNAVENLVFVDEVAVNVISKSATFILSTAESNSLRELQDTVEDCGFRFQILGGLEHVDISLVQKPARTVKLRISGMFCPRCPERVNEVLSKIESTEVIARDQVSMQTAFIKFKYFPNVEKGVTIRAIIDALAKGLSEGSDSNINISIVKKVSIEEHLRILSVRETYGIALRLVLAAIFAIPTFIFGVIGASLLHSQNNFRKWLEDPIWAGNASRMTWILFILATPVYFFVDSVFHTKALLEVRALWRQKNDWQRRVFRFGSMNLLISLGTTVAYFASIALLALSAVTTRESGQMGFTTTYFDSVVFLTLFLLTGRLLESFSKSRTALVISRLSLLKQREATLVEQQSETRFVNDKRMDVDHLEFGDFIRIAPGESPPVDCIIVQGHSGFDESALTGESAPIEHSIGEQVYAGTVNVGSHSLVGKLCALEGQSLLDQIVKTVRDGQLRKAPVEKLADSLTSYFVPLIVLLAIVTWVVWVSLGCSGLLPGHYLDIDLGGWTVWSLEFATSVFVVACPCGIGLAAPTALFVGSGLAAKHGILARGGGAAFQEGSKVSVVCFDKTGTLTLGGKPKVTNFAFHGNQVMRSIVVQTVKDLENASSHPIATGIKDFINNTFGDMLGNVKIPKVEEIAGRGLKGSYVLEGTSEKSPWNLMAPESAILGNEKFMMENNCQLTSSHLRMLADWKLEGKSVAILAIKCSNFFKSEEFFPVSLLAVRDEIRPEARGVIESLQREGIECWMLSGDNELTAGAVAKELNIHNVVAEISPDEKATKLNWIRGTHLVNGRPPVVAFVGDGINDGPALAAADVGVALASGTDLAMNACDFALLSSTNTLCSLLTLFQISRKVFRRVRFNFVWALIYNMIGIPIAAGVIYPYKNSRLSPVWASAAMAASSVSVVTSSLALRLYKPTEVAKDEQEKLNFEKSMPIEQKFP